MGLLSKIFGDYSTKELKRIEPIKNKVLALEEKFSAMSDQELRSMTDKLRERLANGETLDDILPEAFATCREASWRVLKMKHFPVQVIGGIILHQGRIAEMRTGEGKTLVATLPAYLNALAGNGVHIVTVNEYLAKRDSEWMGKVYKFLGLTVGLNTTESLEGKQAAYKADITYGTSNEFGFDYLRDNMVPDKQYRVQRGHFYAIVDEVDSVLIDEARTPLIISGMKEKSSTKYRDANNLVKSMKRVVVVEQNKKEDSDEIYKDADYIVDEKAKTATLTQRGVTKVERRFRIDNLTDEANSELLHHINIAIKAHGVMQRDVDYLVKDGAVYIIDPFTGRIMKGRRYSDGLHQAIEAKEGVKVEDESRTVATITLQNFFRMYKKLSGMTGTAMTEKDEFAEIYNLDAVEIPTNKPIQRTDWADIVYKTEVAKIKAIVAKVKECHERKQPVLVGTASVEKSEMFSAIFKKEGIPHQMLNAKYHGKEAEIIAQAGKLGAVTIATNMAGRGTDIMLGGNSEYLAKNEMRKLGYTDEQIDNATSFADTDDEEILESRRIFKDLENKYKSEIEKEAQEVKELGGLFILGTGRHESRRVDNQLRGRAGRQGDVGESRFYIATDDEMLRIFGGEKLRGVISMFPDKLDEEPLESNMLSSLIERAQRNVESTNFAQRKNVISYDDVMNRQREIIYDQRNQVLESDDIRATILKMLDTCIAEDVAYFCPSDGTEWNLDGLRGKFISWGIIGENELKYTESELEALSPSDIEAKLIEKGREAHKRKEQEFVTVCENEQEGMRQMRAFERKMLLRNVDLSWMDHLDAMDDLKQGIGLRAYANRDPIVEFRAESFDMFDGMTSSIREETVKAVLTTRIIKGIDTNRSSVITITGQGRGGTTAKKEPVRKGPKVGRNDQCPCGSGKKYKKCCGMNQGAVAQDEE